MNILKSRNGTSGSKATQVIQPPYASSIYLIILIGIMWIFMDSPVVAQKSKKRKENKDIPKKEQSKKDRMLTEQFFTEGAKYFILEDYTKSLVFFQKALEMDQNNAAIHYKIAEIYVKNNEFESALPHAIQAKQLDPANKYYYILLAEVYTNKSDFSKATETYKELIENIPGTEEYYFQAAALYIYQQKYDEALNCYNKIEEKFGINQQIIYQKQNILIKQGNLESVIKEGEKLIAAYPEEPDYVADLATKLIANDKYELATDLLNKAIQDFPDNPMILYQLAELYRKTGNDEESKNLIAQIFISPEFSLQKKMQIVAGFLVKDLSEEDKSYALSLSDKIIKYHPEEADAYALYGDLLQNFDSLGAAKDMYLKSLSINSSNFQAWTNILDYELRNNELDSVIKHSDQAITLFPNQAILYYFGGTGQMIKGNNTKAVQLLEYGKRISSSRLELLSIFNSQLGDVYHALKEYDKSDAAYEAALDYDPESDHVLNNYSYFLSIRKEKLDFALEMAAKVIKRNPDNATYLDTYAWILYNLGRFDEARKYIEKAVQQDENVSGTILEHYGDILFKLGDVNGAVEQWENAKILNVDSDLIDKKIADRKLYE